MIERYIEALSTYASDIDALILLRGGADEAALTRLETATDKGYSVEMLAAEPHLASLSEHPRFRVILNSNNSP